MTQYIPNAPSLDGPTMEGLIPHTHRSVCGGGLLLDRAGIVAVIPAFNEERFIASVVLTTMQYAEHVFVVDDGSTDRTAFLAECAGARVIRQPRNMGKAQALNAGFRAAREIADCQVVVCLDGDAQHDPRDVPGIVRPILEGEADIVVGSRFLDVKSEIPAWRQVGQHALTFVTNVSSGVRVSDSQSGFRAFSPTAVQALHFKTGGLSVESEMQFLFRPAGLKIVEAPVSVQYLDGNKRNPVVHGLQVLDALLSLVARRRPLMFFGLPGFLLALCGLLLGLHVMNTLRVGQELPVGTAIATAILLIGGTLVSLTGIILHSLHKLAERIEQDVRSALGHSGVV